MRLHEYQAKRILRRFGVPVPRGQVATSLDQVRQIAGRLGKRVVLKAQVLTGGRGRAGGIRLANDAREAERLAAKMFGMNIKGYRVSKVLVDEEIEIDHEIHVGIAVDRSTALPTISASAQEGIEIASQDLRRGRVARDASERAHRISIDPLLGLRIYQVRELAEQIGLGRDHLAAFVPVALGLYRAFVDCDATLVEANPLVACPDGKMFSLNTGMIIDDNALFRHRTWIDLRDESQETDIERLAWRYGIGYVRLGGRVGCLSNGAGLAMATIDLLRAHGVRAANFVDVGKSGGTEQVARGLQFTCDNRRMPAQSLHPRDEGSIDAVIVNVFCSMTGCDEIAHGILAACDELDLSLPLVVRLEGMNREKGIAILDTCGRANIHLADRELEDVVRKVVALVHGVRGVGGG